MSSMITTSDGGDMMSDNENIMEGFKIWLEEMNDSESERIKKACTKGYISLHELIDALRKHEIEMTRSSYRCQKNQS